MPKLQISKENKTFVYAAAIVALFAVLVVLVYLPMRHKLEGHKAELLGINAEVAAIKKSMPGGKSIDEATRALKADLGTLENKFPGKEEVILRELSTLATKLGIGIDEMRPEKKRAVSSVNGVSVSIRDANVEEMSVGLRVKTYYKTLGDFIRALKKESPIFVSIETVNMSRPAGGDKALLNVEMKLNSYVINPK